MRPFPWIYHKYESIRSDSLSPASDVDDRSKDSLPFFSRQFSPLRRSSTRGISRPLTLLAYLLSIVFAITLLILILFFRGSSDQLNKAPPLHPTPSPIEHRVPPFPAFTTYDDLQQTLADRLSFSPIPPASLQCSTQSLAELEERYRALLSTSGPIFIAANLYNNEEVFPTWASSLIDLIEFIGASRVFVSIFENGSTDFTPLFMAHLAAGLSSAGVDHKVSSSKEKTNWSAVDRIQQLVVYRNIALEPMRNEGNNKTFETVLFINDVYFCVSDALELLHQRKFQNAHATCGLDWKVDENGDHPHFYDNWVSRSLTGNSFTPRFNPLRKYKNGLLDLFKGKGEKPHRKRYLQGLPLPVYSCWNGMIALDSRPFYGISPSKHEEVLPPAPQQHELIPSEPLPLNINPVSTFDVYPMPTWSPPTSFRAANVSDGECAASECTILAKDFWKRGFNRFVLVPSVATTYTQRGKTNHQIQRLAWGMFQTTPQEERIDWASKEYLPPKKVICWAWTSRWHLDWVWLRGNWESPL